jgi:hypothetical protein
VSTTTTKTPKSDISPPTSGPIRDARGRKVTQLDPVALQWLRQYEVIDREVLLAITHERGISISTAERVALVVTCVEVLAVVALLTHSVLTNKFGSAPFARMSSLCFFVFLAWVVWLGAKKKRFAHIAAAMLKYRRCPHCGYDLRSLPPDPADGNTVCPECGCAWKLDQRRDDATIASDIKQ